MSDFTAGAYEVEILHPATADWLIGNGYVYEHHVKMPVSGVADFVAISEDGEMVVIEVKRDPTNLAHDIQQVKFYRDQYDSAANVAIAMPLTKITDKARELAKLTNVRLIELRIVVAVVTFGLTDDADLLDFLRPELAHYFDVDYDFSGNISAVLNFLVKSYLWNVKSDANAMKQLGRGQWNA